MNIISRPENLSLTLGISLLRGGWHCQSRLSAHSCMSLRASCLPPFPLFGESFCEPFLPVFPRATWLCCQISQDRKALSPVQLWGKCHRMVPCYAPMLRRPQSDTSVTETLGRPLQLSSHRCPDYCRARGFLSPPCLSCPCW